MGRVSIVTGRAGSGKSRYLRSEAKRLANDGESVLYIVPEQFTFETERSLSEDMGTGLWNVGVYSFTSLARKVLGEQGDNRVFLSTQGRLMMIRKYAQQLAPQLLFFSKVYRRAGFSEECSKFFIAAKRAMITPEGLKAAAEKLGTNTPFGAKLHDLALIYAAVEGHIHLAGLDGEDAMTALANAVALSPLCKRHIIIDGFDLISNRLYAVIEALITTAKSVTIGIRYCANCRDGSVFAESRRILKSISGLCEKTGQQPEYIHLSQEKKEKSPALSHLEKEAFSFPYKKFQGEAENTISLFAAVGVKEEAEAAAESVLGLIDRGFRYRDIAIILADTGKYLEPTARTLRQRGIPYFTDIKRPLTSYAAAEVTHCALKLAAFNFKKEDMLSLAKTGLCGISKDLSEVFENYVLSRGIRGGIFINPFDQSAPKEAEKARQVLTEPLAELCAGLKNAPTAAEKTKALFAYMQRIGLKESLEKEAADLRAKGNLERAEETTQVYNLILEVLDQLHAILGDAPITLKDYIGVYKEGLSAYSVGVIPSAADQVLLGSLARSKARNVRGLFVLGAGNGSFPCVVSDGGMIDDEERRQLYDMQLGEMSGTGELNDKELSDAYGAVAKPTEYLWLSYCLSDGAESAPCELMDRITDMYADVVLHTGLEDLSPRSPQSAYSRLVKLLRQGSEAGEFSREAFELFAALSKNREYSQKLSQLSTALFPNVSPVPLGEELSLMLYGNGENTLKGGITSLEAFNECPFKHFSRYALRLKPRKEYKELKTDEGIFCHEALQRLTQEIIASGKKAAEITDEDIGAMLDKILPELITTHNNGVLCHTARSRAAAARLVRRVKATAYALVRQLRLGKFNVERSEAEFGRGKDFPAIELELPNGARFLLEGRIDRIDGYTAPSGEHYVRVIDYKTKYGADFDASDIVAGTKLQLPLYVAAIEAVGQAERAAGMYYLPVHEGIMKYDPAKDDFAQKLMQQFRLRGVCLDEGELVEIGGGNDVQPGTRSGWRLTKTQFRHTVTRARQKAQATARAIYGGNGDVSPVLYGGSGANKRTACKYCEYGSLCGFDPTLPGCCYRALKSVKTADFLREAAHDQMD